MGAGRILVVRAGALGDTLMATPVLRALRRQYPEREIDFLCAAAARPLLEFNPAVSRLFVLRQRNWPFFLSPEKWRLVRALRSRAYDLAVLLESTPAYRELLERAGCAEIRAITKTFDPSLHSIQNNLRAAGLGDRLDDLKMDLFITPEEDRRAQEILEPLPRPRIGLHAGWGPPRRKDQQGERLKSWGAENFARLATLLHAKAGGSFLLTGSTDDLAETERLRARLAGSPLPPPTVLTGRTTVRELAALVRQLDLLVSVDSGPAHMAAALERPLVVLWGPAILEQTRPLGDPARIRIVRHRVFCAPCYGTPMMKQCRRNICMEAISPERVAAEAEELLAGI